MSVTLKVLRSNMVLLDHLMWAFLAPNPIPPKFFGTPRYANRPEPKLSACTLRAEVSKAAPGRRNVLVVGAGIIGLTTAIRLAEEGHAVTVVAQQTPYSLLRGQSKGTYTSIGSGGYWMPVLLQGDELQAWGSLTYKTLLQEAPNNGVSIHDALVLHARNDPVLPWYADMTNMSVMSPSDDSRIPSEYHAALRFTTVMVRMDDYLPYLQQRVEKLGVPLLLTSTLGQGEDDDTWDLARTREFAKSTYGKDSRTIVVNCTGIGASRLSTVRMQPGRGVIVRIERPKDKNYAITEIESDGFLSKDGLMAYALPRGNEYSLGGTNFRGDWRETCSPDEISGVVDRALSLLKLHRDNVRIKSTWSGLRPLTMDARARVGFVPDDGDDVIANFGHGGSGVTLCWGCAEHVVGLVRQMSV